jgi:hypothetical protein
MPDNVILAQKAMGGSQDIYDVYHSVKRYGLSQQQLQMDNNNNNNIYSDQNKNR